MIIIAGKTCSGKTTILNELSRRYGYKPIVTYTSRPMRKGEVADKTYHYISKEEFNKKIKQNFFLEYKSYKSVYGEWLYGSAKEDFDNADDNTIIILTPAGYRDFLAKCPNKPHKSLLIKSSDETIRQRLLARGDSPSEAERRLKADNRDFSDDKLFKMSVDNESNTNINILIDEINTLLSE